MEAVCGGERLQRGQKRQRKQRRRRTIKTDSVQTGADNGVSIEETADAVKTEPVIYTNTGKAARPEPDATLSVYDKKKNRPFQKEIYYVQ